MAVHQAAQEVDRASGYCHEYNTVTEGQRSYLLGDIPASPAPIGFFTGKGSAGRGTTQLEPEATFSIRRKELKKSMHLI